MFSEAVRDCLAAVRANALQIGAYLDEVDEVAFEANAEKRDAVERCLERLSEAATRIHRAGIDLDQLAPTIPWRDVRAIGNAFVMPMIGWTRRLSG
ncbi:hypothetical protein BH11PSE2_BH11PSE2_14020 [soil metagenome]